MSHKKKLVYKQDEVKTVVDDLGDEYEKETISYTETRIESEPNYIKLYFDHLGAFKHVSTSLSPLLIELLKYATYADDEEGGMILYLQSNLKQKVIEKINISMTRLDHALMEFCKAGYMKRIGRGTYQVNPYLFGKGDWKNIREIRATYNYNTGEIETKFIKKKESNKKVEKFINTVLCNMPNSTVENVRGGRKYPKIGENRM